VITLGADGPYFAAKRGSTSPGSRVSATGMAGFEQLVARSEAMSHGPASRIVVAAWPSAPATCEAPGAAAVAGCEQARGFSSAATEQDESASVGEGSCAATEVDLGAGDLGLGPPVRAAVAGHVQSPVIRDGRSFDAALGTDEPARPLARHLKYGSRFGSGSPPDEKA